MASCMRAGMEAVGQGGLGSSPVPLFNSSGSFWCLRPVFPSNPLDEEGVLCRLRNMFILRCLWIFDALLILSLVLPIAAEEQLGCEILTLVWKKKENEASHSHISEVFTGGILDRKDHIHTVSQICLLPAWAPTSTTAGTAGTCSSECADPVYTGCVGLSPETHAQAFALNRLPVQQPCRIRWMGKEVYVSPKAHERSCFFRAVQLHIAIQRRRETTEERKKKKLLSARLYRNSWLVITRVWLAKGLILPMERKIF